MRGFAERFEAKYAAAVKRVRKKVQEDGLSAEEIWKAVDDFSIRVRSENIFNQDLIDAVVMKTQREEFYKGITPEELNDVLITLC